MFLFIDFMLNEGRRSCKSVSVWVI